MTSLNLADADPAESTVDAVVDRRAQRRRRRRARCCWRRARRASRPRSTAGGAGRHAAPARRDRRAGEVTKLATLGAITAPVLVAVGLGPEPTGAAPGDPETLRRAAGAAVRALAGRRPGGAGAAAARRSRPAVAEGALLGAYRFAGYKTRPAADRRDPVARGVRRRCRTPADARGARRAQARGHGDRRGRPGPGLGQHRAQRAAPAGVRRRGRGGGRRGRPRGRGARREGAAQRAATAASSRSGRARRRRRGWSGWPTRRAGAKKRRRAGRQGHHLRHRRRVDQAGRRACGR